MKKTTINNFVKEVSKILIEVARLTNDEIDYIRECDVKVLNFYGGEREVLEIDYVFKSGKWGFIELHESWEENGVAVNASNEPHGDLEVEDYLGYYGNWQDKLAVTLLECHG